MLILTRRVGEEVVFGDFSTLVILGTKGNQIRLGITAPKGFPVHRKEIFTKIAGEGQPMLNEWALIPTKVTPDMKDRLIAPNGRNDDGTPVAFEAQDVLDAIQEFSAERVDA